MFSGLSITESRVTENSTPHTANLVQDWCERKFGANFINKQQWPPRPPDLNPCAYFIWGYLKSKVYKPLPKTLDDLKANIRREVEKINTSTLESTFLNFFERCQLVVEKNAGQFENKQNIFLIIKFQVDLSLK